MRQSPEIETQQALLLGTSPCRQLLAELHLLFASEVVPAKVDVPHGVSSSSWLLHSKDRMLHFALTDCTRVQSDRGFHAALQTAWLDHKATNMAEISHCHNSQPGSILNWAGAFLS